APPPPDPKLELVEIVPSPLAPRAGEVGGGTPATEKTETPRATATRDVRVPHRSHRDGDHPMRVADLVGTQSIEQRGDGGMGQGRGGGIGNDEGGDDGGVTCDVRCLGRAPSPPPPPPPPPPPEEARSKARVAKLVYPVRQRDIDADSQLFVAQVTIDEDG